MPEEFKGLMKDLDRDVRSLRRYWRANLVVMTVMVGLAVWWVVAALNVRHEVHKQIQQLACLAVVHTPKGVSQTVDDLRSTYDCPRYKPTGH